MAKEGTYLVKNQFTSCNVRNDDCLLTFGYLSVTHRQDYVAKLDHGKDETY